MSHMSDMSDMPDPILFRENEVKPIPFPLTIFIKASQVFEPVIKEIESTGFILLPKQKDISSALGVYGLPSKLLKIPTRTITESLMNMSKESDFYSTIRQQYATLAYNSFKEVGTPISYDLSAGLAQMRINKLKYDIVYDTDTESLLTSIDEYIQGKIEDKVNKKTGKR